MNAGRSIPLAFTWILIASIGRAAPGAEPASPPAPRVTYAASAVTLERMAETLSATTGVSIRIGSGERDWRVRERRVHVEFRDITLDAALSATAGTLGYRIRKTMVSDRPIYRIWQDAAGREYEAAMRTAQQDAGESEIRSTRETALKEAESALAMTPEDALKLRQTNPWMAFLGGTESGRAYAQALRAMPADTRELMLRGRKATLEVTALPPGIQAALTGLLPEKARAALESEPEGAVYRGIVPARIVFQPLTAEMGAGPDAALGAAGIAVVLGEPRESSPESRAIEDRSPFRALGKGVPMASLPMVDAGSPMGRLMGRFLLRLDAGDSFRAAQREVDEGMGRAAATADAARRIAPSTLPADPRLGDAIDPLTVKADAATRDAGTADLIRRLARKTGCSYVLEFYPRDAPGTIDLPSERMPVHRLLDWLQLSGLGWEFSNGIVRIRPRDWAIQRSYDLPESFLEVQRARLSKSGWLDLDAVASIVASLTDGQIEHRFLLDPDLGALRDALVAVGGGYRAMLRLYGSLDLGRKARMKTPDGLPIESLAGEWRTVSDLVEEETGSPEAGPGTIRLALRRAPLGGSPGSPPDGGDLIATFRISLDGEPPGPSSEIVREIRLPGKLALRRYRDRSR